MTQTALAKELGVAFQQVHKKEGGANQVSSSRLVQIAEALEVDPSFFFPGNGKADRVESEVLGLLNTMGATRLLRVFAEIGERQRATLNRRADGVIAQFKGPALLGQPWTCPPTTHSHRQRVLPKPNSWQRSCLYGRQVSLIVLLVVTRHLPAVVFHAGTCTKNEMRDE
jgi:transcriptional regulator with XRE-family HTH domain